MAGPDKIARSIGALVRAMDSGKPVAASRRLASMGGLAGVRPGGMAADLSVRIDPRAVARGVAGAVDDRMRALDAAYPATEIAPSYPAAARLFTPEQREAMLMGEFGDIQSVYDNALSLPAMDRASGAMAAGDEVPRIGGMSAGEYLTSLGYRPNPIPDALRIDARPGEELLFGRLGAYRRRGAGGQYAADPSVLPLLAAVGAAAPPVFNALQPPEETPEENRVVRPLTTADLAAVTSPPPEVLTEPTELSPEDEALIADLLPVIGDEDARLLRYYLESGDQEALQRMLTETL